MRAIIVLIVAVHAVVVAQEAPPAAKPEPKPPEFDLRVDPKVGEMIAVEVRGEFPGTLTVGEGKKTVKRPMHKKYSMKLLDLVNKVEGERYDMSRRYASWEMTDSGAIDDPEINGKWVDFTRTKETHCRLRSGRVSERLLNEILKHIDSVGAWAPLPAKATPGKTYEVNITSLAPLLYSLETWPKVATAKLKFDRVEADRKIAVLSGPFRVTATHEEAEGTMELDFSGTMELTVDYGKRRLLMLESDGNVVGKVKVGDVPGTYASKFTVTLKTKTGSAAKRLEKSKPRLRKRRFVIPGSKVAFALPTSWFYLGFNGTLHQYMSCDEPLMVQVHVTPTPTPQAVVDVAVKTIQKSQPNLKFKDVKTRLGKARSAVQPSDDESYNTNIDIIAADRSVVQFLVSGPVSMTKALKPVVASCRNARRIR